MACSVIGLHAVCLRLDSRYLVYPRRESCHVGRSPCLAASSSSATTTARTNSSSRGCTLHAPLPAQVGLGAATASSISCWSGGQRRMAKSSGRRLCGRCHTIVTGPCPTCSVGWTARKPKSWAKGGDRRWRQVRAQRLAIEPNCRTCGAPADQVDHLDGTDYATQRYDLDKTRSLCTPCHRIRTSKQGNRASRGISPDA